MMEFQEVIKNRYSVRSYKDDKVEQEKVQLILEEGRMIPTAHNNQPQRFVVIEAEAELNKVDECTRCRYGAPLVVLVCADHSLCWVRSFDNVDSAFVDASIATTYMMLKATELGLGTCWVMHFDPAKTKKYFNLPDNVEPIAFLPIGYPADESKPTDRHTERIPLKEMIL